MKIDSVKIDSLKRDSLKRDSENIPLADHCKPGENKKNGRRFHLMGCKTVDNKSIVNRITCHSIVNMNVDTRDHHVPKLRFMIHNQGALFNTKYSHKDRQIIQRLQNAFKEYDRDHTVQFSTVCEQQDQRAVLNIASALSTTPNPLSNASLLTVHDFMCEALNQFKQPPS